MVAFPYLPRTFYVKLHLLMVKSLELRITILKQNIDQVRYRLSTLD